MQKQIDFNVTSFNDIPSRFIFQEVPSVEIRGDFPRDRRTKQIAHPLFQQMKELPVLGSYKLKAKWAFFCQLMSNAFFVRDIGACIRYPRSNSMKNAKIKLQTIDAAVQVGIFKEYRAPMGGPFMSRLLLVDGLEDGKVRQLWESRKETARYKLAPDVDELPNSLIDWISETKRKLSVNFPAPEQRFCQIIDMIRKEVAEEYRHLLKYRRQTCFVCLPKRKGIFFSDFHFPKCRLLVEIDGHTHYGKDANKKDADRAVMLQEHFGLSILRFKNWQIEREPLEAIYTPLIESISRGLLPNDRKKFRRVLLRFF